MNIPFEETTVLRAVKYLNKWRYERFTKNYSPQLKLITKSTLSDVAVPYQVVTKFFNPSEIALGDRYNDTQRQAIARIFEEMINEVAKYPNGESYLLTGNLTGQPKKRGVNNAKIIIPIAIGLGLLWLFS